MSRSTPLRLTFYGDDFTGSTDVMEVLTLGGVRTVLFLEPPTADAVAKLEGVEAIGVAGTSRSMTPREMEEALPPVFHDLLALRAPLFHYKTCSTFDSAPGIGSIGRALEIGCELTSTPFVPLVVGAPRLGRYCAFGNLFARSGDSEVFRLDRHPTMRRHPVTPMEESDLRRHLARQTDEPVALFDLPKYAGTPDENDARLEALLDTDRRVVLFDVVSEDQLPAIGRMIWRRATQAPVFALGSSGVESAVTAHWNAARAHDGPRPLPTLGPVERLIVVSGSCSPVTERQIEHAVEHGFVEIPVETSRLMEPASADAARAEAEARARGALEDGRSVVLHTARGPGDPRLHSPVRRAGELAPGSGEGRARTGRCLGAHLGNLLLRLIGTTGVRRVVVAGGDTSGQVAQALGLTALEVAATLAPGAPLCRAHAAGTPLHGLEIVFKGGQVGKDSFFITARVGNP